MIQVSLLQDILAGLALLALVSGAGAALYVGLRDRRRAAGAIASNARLDALLTAAPMQAMLVRTDGRIELSERLADWFGVSPPPRYLPELGGDAAGLTPEDAAALSADIAAAQKAGRAFERAVRVRGSARSLVIRGARAPREAQAPGGVVLWVFDATESEARADRLGEQAAEAQRAFDSLTGLIEAAPLPMWYRGPDLRLTMVNGAYVAAVEGGEAGEVVRRGLELVEVADGGALASAASARDAGRPQVHAAPATIRGERRMLRLFDVPLPTGGVAGFAIDIEDLEQARGGLKRFGDAQRAMLDRLSAGVAQFAADRTLAFCNQPFRRMFAMRGEWLADRPEFDRVIERMREAGRLPEVRDFPGWKAERRDWFVAAGPALDGAIEENWHLPGGVHLRVVAQPLPDGGLLLIFEDRTEQVQLASARDTLLRVRTATFDNLYEALGVFAADGRLQLWNTRFRELWGFDEAFLVTHPRVDALTQAASAKLANPARAALIGELVRAATVERQQRGGRVALADGRHFEFAAVPLPDGNALFTMLDISDSRRIERALRERNRALEAADRVKTAFVANMSYELRTPLTSISGFAEMLHGGYAGKLGQAADNYVEAIIDSTERLALLVDEVLELTQNEGRAPALDMAEIDLGAVARVTAEDVMPLAKRRRLDFAIEILPSAGRVTGDARRLGQIVGQLLRHAASHTPAGGRVLLHADGTATAARIVVSDDGPGTGAATAGGLDTPAPSDIPEGGLPMTGSGLTRARQVIEGHGGTIDLVSEAGQGTLVTITLPRRRAAREK